MLFKHFVTPFRLIQRLNASSANRLEKNPTETLRARLYYQSKKRGILENDILLGGFADSQLKTLSEQELREYDKIINAHHNEWDLYYFCSGKKELPAELSNNPVFDKIVNYVRNLKK